MIASRILLIPVIAAVGYELLRLGARHRGNPIVKVIMWPGILVQTITTKQPTDDMIEVAIVAMEETLRADGEEVPPHGLDLARDLMPEPGETAAAVRAMADAEAPKRRPPSPRTRRSPADGTADPMTDTGLDGKLAELALQYDDVTAQLGTLRGPRPIPTSCAPSAASCPVSSPSSRRSASSTTSASSWPARARCASTRTTTR